MFKILIFCVLFSFILAAKKDIPIYVTEKGVLQNYDLSYEKFELIGLKAENYLRKSLSHITNYFTLNKPIYCIVASLKEKSSLERKLSLEIESKTSPEGKQYKDFEKITDFIRSTILVTSIEQINEVFQLLKNKFGIPLKDENTYSEERFPNGKYDSGYRDRNLVFQFNEFFLETDKFVSPKNYPQNIGLKFEIQINLCGMFVAKSIGHSIYEIIRIVKNIKQNKSFNEIISAVKDDNMVGFNKNIKKIKNIILYMNNTHLQEKFEKVFSKWNNDRDNEEKALKFKKFLNFLSLKLYNAAKNTDQIDCAHKIKKLFDNKICKINGKKDLVKFAKEFVKNNKEIK